MNDILKKVLTTIIVVVVGGYLLVTIPYKLTYGNNTQHEQKSFEDTFGTKNK